MSMVPNKRVLFDVHFHLYKINTFCQDNRVKKGSNTIIIIADIIISDRPNACKGTDEVICINYGGS